MKVVADSHAIDWYLISPEQLSDVALDVLGEAEDTQGIASALTMPELWMAATRKRGPQALPRTGNPPLCSQREEREGHQPAEGRG